MLRFKGFGSCLMISGTHRHFAAQFLFLSYLTINCTFWNFFGRFFFNYGNFVSIGGAMVTVNISIC